MTVKIKTIEKIAGVLIIATTVSFLIGGQSLLMKFIAGDVIMITVALICALVFKIKPEA